MFHKACIKHLNELLISTKKPAAFIFLQNPCRNLQNTWKFIYFLLIFLLGKSEDLGRQAVGNWWLLILSYLNWWQCTRFTQRAMWHAPSPINDTFHYYSNLLFRLYREGDVIQPLCLRRMGLFPTSPVAWNNYSTAAVSVTIAEISVVIKKIFSSFGVLVSSFVSGCSIKKLFKMLCVKIWQFSYFF